MITFKINNQKIECPITWDEITVEQYIKLKDAKNVSEVFKALTGFDLYISEEQLERDFFPFLTFIADRPDFDSLPLTEYIQGASAPLKNLGHGTFGQKIAAQKIISKAFKGQSKVDVTSFMVDVLEVYIKIEKNKINSLKFIQAYPYFNHICKEILRLVKRDKQYLEQKPDSELTLAGVERLSKFGEMRIIDQLAGGDLLKYEKIIEIEYDVIFKKLWYIAEQGAFRERLHKLQMKKQKQAA